MVDLLRRSGKSIIVGLGVALLASSAVAQRVPDLPQASVPYGGTETFSFDQLGRSVRDTFGNFRSFVIGTLFPPIYPACTGVANDDAVLKAAITAAQGTANALVFTGFCVVSSTIPVTAGITIRGSGALKSGIVTTATTGDVLAVQTPDQVDFEDFGVQVNGANWGTSGAAISLNGASGGGVNNYNGKSYLSNIYIRGTYDGLRLDNASDLRTVGLYIEDTTHDNVLKVNAQNPDAGQDHHIGPTWRNLNRGSTPNAGYEHLSGGDIEIVGGKIIGQKYGLLANSTYGPTGTITISGVSFEENSIARIAALQAVSGIEFGNLVIVGNQFSNITSGAGRLLMIGTGTPTTASKWIRNITFIGNLSNDFSTFSGDSSISILDGDNINISGNALNNNSTAGPTAIRISANATNVTCGLNQLSNYPTGTYFDGNSSSVCTKVAPTWPTVNARDYGACAWDSAHDVGSCINLAITGASALGGGAVNVPQGTYGLSTTLTINTPFVKLVSLAGPGDHHDVGTSPTGGTIFTWIGSAGGTMAQVAPVTGASAQRLSGVGLENITLKCDGSATAGIGLQVENVSRGRFQGTTGWECSAAGIDLTVNSPLGEVEGNDRIIFEDILTQNIGAGDGGHGIRMRGDATGNTNGVEFNNVATFIHNGDGFKIYAGDNNHIHNHKWYRTTGGFGRPIDFNQSYVLNGGQGSNSNFVDGIFGSAASGTAAITLVGTGGTDGVSNGTTTYTSATGDFDPQDVGKGFTGTDIPGGTTIATVVSPTSITLSAAATGSHTGNSYTVTGRNAAYVNVVRNADTTNPGQADPVKGTGAGLTHTDDRGYQTGGGLLNGVAGENAASIAQGLARKAAAESFHIFNQSSDALRVDDGTKQFGINQDGSHNLRIGLAGGTIGIQLDATTAAPSFPGLGATPTGKRILCIDNVTGALSIGTAGGAC